MDQELDRLAERLQETAFDDSLAVERDTMADSDTQEAPNNFKCTKRMPKAVRTSQEIRARRAGHEEKKLADKEM